jgi:hypothetical protein
MEDLNFTTRIIGDKVLCNLYGEVEGVVCLCSRGLIHSRTIASLLAELPRDWKIIITHDLPIPEAQIQITEEALAMKPSFILFIEEDMGLPVGILEEMIGMDKPVVTADYPLAAFDEALGKWVGVGRSVRRDGSGFIRFCGMGCLLIKAEVFSQIKKPWFETNMITDEGGIMGVKRSYGGQDVWLSRQIRAAGYEIAEVPLACKHYRLADPGKITSNKGVHEIIEISSVA